MSAIINKIIDVPKEKRKEVEGHVLFYVKDNIRFAIDVVRSGISRDKKPFRYASFLEHIEDDEWKAILLMDIVLAHRRIQDTHRLN